MTTFIRFHLSSLHCAENITLQRKKLKRSVEEVTPSAPQESCKTEKALRIEDTIGDGSYLRHLGDVMDADDVRTGQNARSNGSGRRKNTLIGRNCLVAPQRCEPFQGPRRMPRLF